MKNLNMPVLKNKNHIKNKIIKIKKKDCIGKTKSETLFKSLAWDTYGEESTYPCGIIVGGMVDGSVTIWDPNVIINYWKTN